ncbi:MAG: acetyl-CoA C-acyltransferase, partial [Bdellovibrionales bacterium]|nr:acetyl-CoA C-acyltransferase [Bdellovibrionales bacterium]
MTRVAIIGGCRTPFTKAGTKLARYSFLDLGKHVVEGTVKRLELKGDEIDEVAFSTVLLDPRTPNAARELVLRSSLPHSVGAHFVSNNCISGLVAANLISEGIQSGRLQCGIAGGSESMSQPTLTFQKKAELFFLQLFGARTMGAKLSQLSKFRPGFLLPQPPSPKEPSTGKTMGQHCEMMAKEFSVAREAQDKIAFTSHQNGARAQKAGYLAQEIEPIGGVDQDNIIRESTTLEKLASLRPVFDRSEKGTLTAGNSSALTDGASAVCL